MTIANKKQMSGNRAMNQLSTFSAGRRNIQRGLGLLLGFSLLSLMACQSRQAEVKQEATVDSLTAPLSTPTPTPTADPRVTDFSRVKEGMVAPDFALEDVNGIVHHLSDYREKKNVILVFYRGHF
jgi:hypothetical protein